MRATEREREESAEKLAASLAAEPSGQQASYVKMREVVSTSQLGQTLGESDDNDYDENKRVSENLDLGTYAQNGREIEMKWELRVRI